jgi:hypothetical protein
MYGAEDASFVSMTKSIAFDILLLLLLLLLHHFHIALVAVF